MLLIKIILFTMTVILASFILGNSVMSIASKWIGNVRGSGVRIYAGAVAMILIGMVIAGLGGVIKLDTSLTFVIVVFADAMVILYGIILCRRNKVKIIDFIGIESKNHAGLKSRWVYFILAGLIILQIVVAITMSYDRFTALRGVSVATRVYDLGICTKGSFIMNLWGVISLLIREHPLTFIYTILPITMISLYYLGYYEVFRITFNGNDKKTSYGLIAVALLNIWGYQSDALLPIDIMVSWFNGWCFAINGLLIAISLFVIYRRCYMINTNDDISESKMEEVEIYEESDDYQEEWDMKKHRIINARNLAIGLGILTVMLLAFVFVLNNKINNLHAATANLQVDLDKRSSVYEFVPIDGKTAGYLIKGKDGNLTMIGGGDAENADELCDFISEYGMDIENWYLYSTDEKDIGAYRRCTNEKKIKVNNTYILNRVEIEGQ